MKYTPKNTSQIILRGIIDQDDKKYVMKYTTVSGVDGFDGTRKEAPKAVVKKIE